MKYRKLILIAVIGALSGALAAAESMIAIDILPGGRIGLANIALIITVELYGFRETAAVSLLKSILALLITGSVTGFAYSVCGGLAAAFVMSVVRKIKGISAAGIGVSGAFANNLVQTAVAAIVMTNPYIFYYIGILGPVSVVTGVFTGITAKMCVKYINKKEISYV